MCDEELTEIDIGYLICRADVIDCTYCTTVKDGIKGVSGIGSV
jgi:hypothetical protein